MPEHKIIPRVSPRVQHSHRQYVCLFSHYWKFGFPQKTQLRSLYLGRKFTLTCEKEGTIIHLGFRKQRRSLWSPYECALHSSLQDAGLTLLVPSFGHIQKTVKQNPMHINEIPVPYRNYISDGNWAHQQHRGGGCPSRAAHSEAQQMLLDKRGRVTVSSKGQKHAHCASICAEKRKPGKQQIPDLLKALVHKQQRYAYVQKWPRAISKKEMATKDLALVQGESIRLLVYSLIV